MHQIPVRAPRDDPSHRIVTPGGMVLSTPKMVAATDVLAIVARDRDVMCFELVTLARERHTCKLAGVARKESEHAYLFRDGRGAVRFTFSGEDEVHVEPLDKEHRSRCEPLGRIEPAIYTVSQEAQR